MKQPDTQTSIGYYVNYFLNRYLCHQLEVPPILQLYTFIFSHIIMSPFLITKFIIQIYIL
jgi:hypothetical protein